MKNHVIWKEMRTLVGIHGFGACKYGHPHSLSGCRLAYSNYFYVCQKISNDYIKILVHVPEVSAWILLHIISNSTVQYGLYSLFLTLHNHVAKPAGEWWQPPCQAEVAVVISVHQARVHCKCSYPTVCKIYITFSFCSVLIDYFIIVHRGHCS